MLLQEKWKELKETSNHTCNCNFCSTAILIAEKSFLYVTREESANDLDELFERLIKSDFRPFGEGG